MVVAARAGRTKGEGAPTAGCVRAGAGLGNAIRYGSLDLMDLISSEKCTASLHFLEHHLTRTGDMFRVRSCQKKVVRGGCFAVVRGPTDVAIATAAKFHVRRSHASVTSQSKCVSLTPFLLSPRLPYNSREQIVRELLLLALL